MRVLGAGEAGAIGRRLRTASARPGFEYRLNRIHTQRMRALALTRRPKPGTLPDVIQMIEMRCACAP